MKKQDFFSIMNIEKYIGKTLEEFMKEVEFNDDEVRPVIDKSNLTNKLVGFIYLTENQEEFKNTPIDELGLEEICGKYIAIY